jgi:hypothetical protein
MQNYTLLIILSLISISAHSETTIECKPIKIGESILITLGAKKFKLSSLNCIETKKDLGEGEICAPENGWGLQYPTGTAKISQIVFRWQEYMDHHGSIIGNKTTKTEMKFTSGRNESPEKGYVQDWSLSLNRISGSAKLIIGDVGENFKNNKSEEFTCGKVSAKF